MLDFKRFRWDNVGERVISPILDVKGLKIKNSKLLLPGKICILNREGNVFDPVGNPSQHRLKMKIILPTKRNLWEKALSWGDMDRPQKKESSRDDQIEKSRVAHL